MKVTIEIDIPELDSLYSQDKELRAIDEEFRALLAPGQTGIVIDKAVALLDRARLLSSKPSVELNDEWLKDVLRFHVTNDLIPLHANMRERSRSLLKNLDRHTPIANHISYQDSMKHIEKLAGASAASRINQYIKEHVLSQLERTEDESATPKAS